MPTIIRNGITYGGSVVTQHKVYPTDSNPIVVGKMGTKDVYQVYLTGTTSNGSSDDVIGNIGTGKIVLAITGTIEANTNNVVTSINFTNDASGWTQGVLYQKDTGEICIVKQSIYYGQKYYILVTYVDA